MGYTCLLTIVFCAPFLMKEMRPFTISIECFLHSQYTRVTALLTLEHLHPAPSQPRPALAFVPRLIFVPAPSMSPHNSILFLNPTSPPLICSSPPPPLVLLFLVVSCAHLCHRRDRCDRLGLAGLLLIVVIVLLIVCSLFWWWSWRKPYSESNEISES